MPTLADIYDALDKIYRAMPGRMLDDVRRAFELDLAEAERTGNTIGIEFCRGRLDVINAILIERQDRAAGSTT